MAQVLTKYALFAGAFDYPDASTGMVLDLIEKMLRDSCQEAAIEFSLFASPWSMLNPDQQEEYFVHTFEVEALTTMDIGYLLFGEDYKRGAFLALLQEEHQLAGNRLGHELADHLPNVLRLLPVMTHPPTAMELACSLVIPAVGEIIQKLEGSANHFLHAFRALHLTMQSDFGQLPYAPFKPRHESGCSPPGYGCGSDFLKDLGTTKY